MICFPNAKINLGLNIIEKRTDGFHNIETVFYPIQWCDALEAVENKGFRKGEEKLQLSFSGIAIEGNPSDNLINRAYKLINENYQLPPLKVHLHKVIPIGAGLGGGSSDAAFFIKLLNDKFQLNLSTEEQKDFAKPLGSDCAFFIENKPLFAEEKGEVFSEVKVDLSDYHIVVVYPNIHSNTAVAYKNILPQKPAEHIKSVIALEAGSWKEKLQNGFEKNIFRIYPELQRIKELFYAKGAVYASMSGSGSAMFGLFEKEVELKEFGFEASYKAWKN